MAGLSAHMLDFQVSQAEQSTVLRRAEEPFHMAVRNGVEWGWSWRQPYLEASPHLFHLLLLVAKTWANLILARSALA